MDDVFPNVSDSYVEYFFLMYGTNSHFWSFVGFTYTGCLALDHPLLALEVNELCGLCCYVEGPMCPSVSR